MLINLLSTDTQFNSYNQGWNAAIIHLLQNEVNGTTEKEKFNNSIIRAVADSDLKDFSNVSIDIVKRYKEDDKKLAFVKYLTETVKSYLDKYYLMDFKRIANEYFSK